MSHYAADYHSHTVRRPFCARSLPFLPCAFLTQRKADRLHCQNFAVLESSLARAGTKVNTSLLAEANKGKRIAPELVDELGWFSR